MRNYVYDKAGGKGSILNTKVTTKGLVKTIGGAFLGAGMIASMYGCGSYGNIRPSEMYNSPKEIKEDTGLNYFWAGTSKDSLKAIMGLDKSENPNNDSWHPLDKSFYNSVEDLNNQTSDVQGTLRKSEIISPEGRDVGDLYFNGINSGILIKRKKDGTFYISTPDVSVSGGGGSSGSSGGGGGGGGCFLGGTKILMADGSSKNIRDIRENDKVMSYSFDSNTAAPDVVGEKYSVERDEGLYSVNGVCVTKEHPFFEEADKQTIVSGLRKGQEVMGDSNHNPKTLENIAIGDIRELEMPGEFEVFNIKTENNHNYFVLDDKGNFFLVHNKGGGK